MDAEVWMPIRNLEPYQVSNRACVKGYGGKRMKPYLDPHGYYSFKFRKDGKYVKKYLHQLVSEYFVPNPDNNDVIDHINRTKTDNRPENLRWCSKSENNWNSARHDTDMYGIYWYEKRKAYLVKIKLNNVQRYIGWRKTIEEAKMIRDEAKQALDMELHTADVFPS